MPRPGKDVEKPKDFNASIKRLFKNLKPWKVLLTISLLLALFSAILSLVTPNKLSDFADLISDGLKPNTKVLEEISVEISKNFTEDNIKNKIGYYPENEDNFNMSSMSEEDKKSLINLLPDDTILYFLEDIEIQNKTITKQDELKFIRIMSNMDKDDQNSLLESFDKLPKSIYNLVKPKIDMKKIKKVSIVLILLLVLSSVFGYIQSFVMATVSNKFAKSLRSRVTSKINRLPLKYFDNHETGDILSRITNDIDTIAQSLNMSLATLVTSITLFIGSIIMMFITNYIMAITAILSSLFGFAFMAKILSKSQKYFEKRQKDLGELNGYIEEIY